MTTTTRRQIPASEKAQERVDVLRRRLDKITALQRTLDEQKRTANLEREQIQARLDYALKDPDLPTQPTPATADA